jgi:hypothetical protein
MRRSVGPLAARLLVVVSMAVATAAQGDFELTGPDGRRILLKDDGTWHYGESADQPKDPERTAPTLKQEGEALLVLESKAERGNGCRIAVRLENKFPYEIRSIVPYYSVYRANGVIYDSVSGASGFNSLKPGDRQRREIDFAGIPCKDIVRIQVVGGDRCDMGELTKYSATQGQCLARVRVAPSELVRFDK